MLSPASFWIGGEIDDEKQQTRAQRRREKKRRTQDAAEDAPPASASSLLATPGAFASRAKKTPYDADLGASRAKKTPYDADLGAAVVSRKAFFKARRRTHGYARPAAFERALAAALGRLAPAYGANVAPKRPYDWASLPAALDVGDDGGGGLPEARRARKRQQLENVMWYVDRLARPGDVVVDFCSGCGHQSIPVAYLRRDVTFVLLDKKRWSLLVAERRCEELGLTNVRCVDALVADFGEPFDLGLALHACGGATEDVLESCVRARAAFVVAPCCVGGTANWRNGDYPRSDALRAVLAPALYAELAKAADTNASTRDLRGEPPKHLPRRRLCKSVVEADRLARCVERGYDGMLVLMDPPECTPKNDVIVGWPAGRDVRACFERRPAAPQPPWIPA